MNTLLGIPLSPFVRKVRVVMAEKNLPYDLRPVFPGSDDAEFRALSPLGKIPAFSDERIGLADSSVICAYLEKSHPTPALLPADPVAYAHALWFEEYADTKLFHVCTEGLFFERIVKGRMRGEPADEAKVAASLKELPAVCDYLEQKISAGALGGAAFSLGELAVTTQFVNLNHAGEQVDAASFPKLAALLQKTLARPSFQLCLEDEKSLMASLG
ncbi:MAG: glutathione S-transferase family protein [Immundisolibacter sp.]|uniref:glutathione S-transferase family protein n=1 Tax=Immundisolibacter sp. TaxID=1934948 RepID=UPI003EE037FD